MAIDISTPIAIIGGGGLGANLASVLIEQGYKDILLIDDDESDEKFLNRYGFFGGLRYTNIGINKTEVIQRTIKNRLKSDQTFNTIHAKVDENFDYQKILHRFCIITVDSVGSRSIIEKCLNKINTSFIHVGCNLNSVSIFYTIMDVLGDEEIAGATTSYDAVPDFLTYMRACVETAQFLAEQNIRVFLEDPNDICDEEYEDYSSISE